MAETIKDLNPKAVWKHFHDITQIPRCSGNENAIAQHIIDFATSLGLKHKTDDVGNLIISKPATTGMEDRPTAVIQGHMDMVCEKNKDTKHDFDKDPIKTKIEDGWVTAEGTTLGSDNGIALAMAMAVMEDHNIKHPPMEFLFTVDEETGLTGAQELKSDFVQGRILLNIDSEEEGALYIGCAGGQHTILKKEFDWTHVHDDFTSFVLKVDGLRGGHSGLNINDGLGNAVKLLARVLYNLKDQFHYHIAEINAGSKHNAIPREAEAVIDVPSDKTAELQNTVKEFSRIFADELQFTEKNVKVSAEQTTKVQRVFSTPFRDQLIGVLYAMPHGVMAMSQAIEDLVETSTNMAIIETKENRVEMLTSQRSSVETAVKDIANKIKALGELGDFEVEEGGGYPAWQPDPNSKLLASCKQIYQNKFNEEPEVKAIHAGLECGIIGEHYDGMDMISFGPDILGAHSPDERIRISSVENVWAYLLEILENIK
ncbi:MAG: beta-Ala-His dipeptidase [Caldithrix sp.]|nr:beta-Ala-His dipeptidase [Caldithrix sp.]